MKRPLLVAVPIVVVAILAATVLAVPHLLSGEPDRDAAGLRGRTLALAGADPLHPGQRTDLATLPAPVLVCRIEMRSGHWLAGALKRLLARSAKAPTLVAVFTAADRDPPEWLARSGLPWHGVLADPSTVEAWGFRPDMPEVRLIGADGAVASANLAGDDRDDTIALIEGALAGR